MFKIKASSDFRDGHDSKMAVFCCDFEWFIINHRTSDFISCSLMTQVNAHWQNSQPSLFIELVVILSTAH